MDVAVMVGGAAVRRIIAAEAARHQPTGVTFVIMVVGQKIGPRPGHHPMRRTHPERVVNAVNCSVGCIQRDKQRKEKGDQATHGAGSLTKARRRLITFL